MNIKRKKERLKAKIEKTRSKTMLKEERLKSKIKDKKELIKLKKELKAAETLDIPSEDLALIKEQEKNKFKNVIINKVIPSLKQAGKDWVKRSREKKEQYRRDNKND